MQWFFKTFYFLTLPVLHHGCDNVSMAMLKLCPEEIAMPLSKFATGKFTDAWKLPNVQPIYKKKIRQTKSNYRPISLLPLRGKFF